MMVLPFFRRTIWMASRSNKMTLSSASAVSKCYFFQPTVTPHLTVKLEAPACQLLQYPREPSSAQKTGYR